MTGRIEDDLIVTIELQCIAIDAVDQRALGQWWADALGWDAMEKSLGRHDEIIDSAVVGGDGVVGHQ